MTTLLLDTHVVLWWLGDDDRLTSRGRARVTAADVVCVSAATTWEVAIKSALGKLDIDLAEHASFPAVCLAQGFRLVPVEHQDAWSVRSLPLARTDPFDRLIAATARRRRWTVLTADRAFDDLDVDVARP